MALARTENLVEADGLKTRYLEEGDGPPVVLLHGSALGSSADVWDRNMQPLAAQGLRVIAFDQPGFGRTDDPLDPSAGYRRQFILKLMDALKIERAGLVGHSQAGGFVVHLALAHPERVSRVMVLGTGSLLPPLEGVSTGPPAGETGPTDREPTRADVRAVLEEQLYNHSLITPEVIETRYQVALGHRRAPPLPAPPPTAAGAQQPLWQRLDQLQVPLRMLYGRNDRGSVEARVPILRQRYPNLDVHLAEGCKHLIQWDAAAEFVRLAGPFFREEQTSTGRGGDR